MSSESFYGGTNYGLSPDYGDPIGPYVKASQISLATDARIANQIKTVSEKVNTGAKAVEVQLTIPNVAEAIPNSHLEEINRLRKITGIALTLHGPLVEPTGIDARGGRWDANLREQAERQIWSAVDRAHKVDPDGNIVVTLHSSNGLPEPETKVWAGDLTDEEKKQGGRVTGLFVIDKRTGQFGQLPKPKEDYLTGKSSDIKLELDNLNKERWSQSLSNITIEAGRAREVFNKIERVKDEVKDTENLKGMGPVEIYAELKTDKGKEFYERLNTDEKKIADEYLHDLGYAEVFTKDSYRGFKELFNEAYDKAKQNAENGNKKDFEQLEKLRKDISPLVKEYEKSRDPLKLVELGNSVFKGIRVLDDITPPKTFEPIKDFAIEESGRTFGNVAFEAYKKFGDSSPIISIENPPAGSGINRAEDLKLLVEKSRDFFVEKAMKEKGLSKDEAKDQAKKLIGSTWDVGHINMIRKFGYGDEELKQQTKTIAPYVKNIHLSDNFGMEHTELPMGMGNVPMKDHLKVLKDQFGDKLDKIKQVVETGDWYQHFQTTPFVETLQSFGSPIYGMRMGPAWNQAAGNMGGYFAGYGMNPDVHHSIYGAGFAGLPLEVGGQIAGRSRLSGAPVE